MLYPVKPSFLIKSIWFTGGAAAAYGAYYATFKDLWSGAKQVHACPQLNLSNGFIARISYDVRLYFILVLTHWLLHCLSASTIHSELLHRPPAPPASRSNLGTSTCSCHPASCSRLHHHSRTVPVRAPQAFGVLLAGRAGAWHPATSDAGGCRAQAAGAAVWPCSSCSPRCSVEHFH